jgi:hypothetical protein
MSSPSRKETLQVPTDKRSVQRLDFPTPANSGEPTAYLTIAMNIRGECHVHPNGSMEQGLFLSTQALNYVIPGNVIKVLQRTMAEAALLRSPARGGTS